MGASSTRTGSVPGSVLWSQSCTTLSTTTKTKTLLTVSLDAKTALRRFGPDHESLFSSWSVVELNWFGEWSAE